MNDEPSFEPTAIRGRLLRQRDELIARLQQELRDEGDLVAERDPEPEELAARHGLAELLDRLGTRDLEELGRIDAALARVDAGVYGRCTSCGDMIDRDRLRALPEAEQCTECRALMEASARP